MKLYKIYSGGGGAGDWLGVNRVFQNLPDRAKENILLKYGDVFLNHAASKRNGISRTNRLNKILSLRDWFFEKTKDPSVYDINILLDTGAAKITSWIQAELSDVPTESLLPEFDKIIQETNLLKHYAKVIVASKVNKAISLDIPNPFKMRSLDVSRKLNVANHNEYEEIYVDLCAKYTNLLFDEISNLSNPEWAKDVLMATIDGSWSKDSFERYIDKLSFSPKNLAIGGLVGFKGIKFHHAIINCLNSIGDISRFDQVHFLGCGGVRNTKVLLSLIEHSNNLSADVSTPINRVIDGNVKGTEVSKYYKYQEFNKMIKVSEENIEYIIKDNNQSINPLYDESELKDLLNKILQHQSGIPGDETYDARAKLIFHNYDAYQHYADNY